jgi:hypothetical protein
MSGVMMPRRDTPKPPAALKGLWRAALDAHPIQLAWSPDSQIDRKKATLLASTAFKDAIAGVVWSPDDRWIAIAGIGTITVAALLSSLPGVGHERW